MNRSVVVNFAESYVSVDGEGYRCQLVIPSNLVRMSWDGASGLSEFADGSGGPFSDFSLIEPYLAVWEAAKIRADADKAAAAEFQRATEAAEAEARSEQDAAQKVIEEQQAARAALKELRRPHDEAMGALFGTDHEVIKAMEAQLAQSGALSPEFVMQRAEWREIVKAERPKLEQKQ